MRKLVLRTVQESVDEIIDLAASEKGSVATLLRKCLVLGDTLKNNQLKVWAENELLGFEGKDDELPEYRKVPALAKGLFIAPRGGAINEQPIPSVMLEEHHRYLAETALLVQPIASYEGVTRGGSVEWPPNITALYERRFFQGTYALNRAWQDLPASIFVGLIDTIKTRVLRFALELRKDLGAVSDDVTRLPESTIDRNVTVNIFGGSNVIASKDFAQVNRIKIERGDWAGLAEALNALGVPPSEISELKSAVADDSGDATIAPVAQGRTAKWLKKFATNAGKWALKGGAEVGKQIITKWLEEYFGFGN
jgi:hypothetical protein